MFFKTDSPTEPLPSEVGVGEGNSQQLISFFLGILLAIQDAASSAWWCPEPQESEPHVSTHSVSVRLTLWAALGVSCPLSLGWPRQWEIKGREESLLEFLPCPLSLHLNVTI